MALDVARAEHKSAQAALYNAELPAFQADEPRALQRVRNVGYNRHGLMSSGRHVALDIAC